MIKLYCKFESIVPRTMPLGKTVRKMKRIITACLEQTIKFESSEEFEAFKEQLTRKGTKFKVTNTENNGSNVIVRLKKQYNGYDVGSYLD